MSNKISIASGKKNKIFLPIFIILICGIIIFSFILRHSEKIAQKNIQKVLQTAFLCPDPAMENIFHTAYNAKGKDVKISPEDYDANARMRNLYSKYFTDNGLESFISYWSPFSYLCATTEWKTTAKEIELTNDGDKQYKFKVIIEYWKENVKDQEIIMGKTQRNSNGKLTYLRLDDNSYKKLNELNQMFLNDLGNE